jgi:Rap1 GTPase-GDP dissociation stimulator 1
MNSLEQAQTFVWTTVCLSQTARFQNTNKHPDDNRQLLLSANFPQVVVSLLHRYLVQLEPLRPLPVSLMELKILKTTAGVILNTSLYFGTSERGSIYCSLHGFHFSDPIREYFIAASVPETLLYLQTRVYPPCSWATVNSDQNESSYTKEEWVWRSGFSSWASLALSELFRDNGERSFSLSFLSVSSFFLDQPRIFPEGKAPLVALVDVLTKFTPPFPTSTGHLVDDPTARHGLITADVELLTDVSSLLESLALDSEYVQVSLAETVSSASHVTGPCLIKSILDFVEFGNYPPYWSKETPSERAKREKEFDMCKAAIIKAIVEVTGALRCIDILWDLNSPDGWFVSRLIRWIRTNITSTRDDLMVCATLCLGNLARRGVYEALNQ